MAFDWTAEQDRLLTHEAWSDEDLATAVSLIGPARSIKAVSERRRTLGYRAPFRTGRTVEVSRERAFQQMTGWPVMSGPEEDRDAKYVAMLRRAQALALKASKCKCKCKTCVACYDWGRSLECVA